MMEETATVIRCPGDGWVTVEVKVKNACNHCDNNDTCGTSAVSKAFSPKVQRFSLPSDEQYEPGELLKLGLPESVILKAAAIVYLMPLAGLFIGAALGHFLADLSGLSSSDLLAIALGAGGAVSAWWLGRRWAKALETNSQPVILSRLGRAIDGISPAS
ncbi:MULTISPECIES: SoxR reducing system RseC family protein [Shewanella]|uniref:SoxR reducing system RseC family protein n=1 Tax=Shewanella TaxID=22 RepID=UPI001EFC9B70|nr:MULTISPECIES: SoxR reducing system RseC family protein [Shewanella]MCG9745559.1 SoxR reducing system RseC family protein [Shewanella sp. Isolate8]MCL2910332.1 SoxR reducing system RseC family protein [Shewanella aquimarina]